MDTPLGSLTLPLRDSVFIALKNILVRSEYRMTGVDANTNRDVDNPKVVATTVGLAESDVPRDAGLSFRRAKRPTKSKGPSQRDR